MSVEEQLAAVLERLATIESNQAEMAERLATLEKKKAPAKKGGRVTPRTDRSKALKPSAVKKPLKKPVTTPKKGGKKTGTTPTPKKKKKLAADRPKVPDERKISYHFGSRKLTVARPTAGYPPQDEAAVMPAEELSIGWVHGFAGNKPDGYKSMHVTKDGSKLVYFVACFGVVYDVAEDTQKYFRMHNDDITCIALNPEGTLVATGQKDPKDEPGMGKALPNIYVWDIETQKPVAFLDDVCVRKVLRVQFSANSGFLYAIAGDDDQTLKGYDPDNFTLKGNAPCAMELTTYRQKIFGFIVNPTPADGIFDELLSFGERMFTQILLTESGGSYALEKHNISVMKFHKDGERAFTDAIYLTDGRWAVSGSSGHVYVGRGKDCLSTVKAHDKAVGALGLLANGLLVSAGHDEKLKRWNILAEDKKKQLKLESMHEPVVEDSDFHFRPKAMAVCGESETVFVGSKTNQICKYNTCDDEKSPASMIIDGHDGQIWGIGCHPTEPLFCTGGWDNAVKVWHAPTHKCVLTLEFPIQAGYKKGKKINQIAWSGDGSLIVAGTEDSNVAVVQYTAEELVFKGFTNIPPKSKSAEVEGVSYLRFAEDSKRIAVAHMDANVYVYDIEKAEGGEVTLKQWAPLKHGTAPTHVRFSADSKWLQSFTRDYEIQTWKLDLKKRKGKFDPFLSDPDLVQWAGDPLIAGWDTQGLYQSQEEWDGTDLNDASLSPDGALIVSGDDYGNVRLHKYPAVDPTACKKYPGHAEFVVGIEFLSTQSEVVSCGGADMAVVQWVVSAE